MQDISLDESFFENFFEKLVNAYTKSDYDELQKLWITFTLSNINDEHKKSMLKTILFKKFLKLI
jgi:hypothetical protein